MRDLVVLHGGHIEAHSKGVNQGSLFVVTLPVVAADGAGADGPQFILAST